MKVMKIMAMAVLLLVGGAQATVLTTSGDWFTPANWDAGIPTAGTVAAISNGLSATAASAGGAASIVYVSGGGGLTVNSGGAIAVGGSTYAGYYSGLGSLNITGGTYSDAGLVVSFNNTAGGIVNVSGGTYNVGGQVILGRGRNVTQSELNVSGTGIFNAAGQTVLVGYDRLATGVKIDVSGGQFISGILQARANGLNTSFYDINISGGSVSSSAWDFSPGASIGTLNIDGSSASINVGGNVTLDSAMTFNAALDASGFSTINATGAADLQSSALVVSLLGGATVGDLVGTHKLIDAASLSGTFASVDLSAFGGDASLVYDTDNGDVLLNVVPEPVTIGMLGLGTALLIFVRRFMR